MILSVESQQRLERLLVEQGLLTKEALENARLAANHQNQQLLAYLDEQHIVDNENLTKLTAEVSGVPYVNLASAQVPPEVMRSFPKSVAENYLAVPFGTMKGRLAVAMLDPSNVQAVDFLSRKTGSSLSVYAASRASIDRVLALYPTDVSADVNEAVSAESSEVAADAKAASQSKRGDKPQSLQRLVQDAPITRALNAILENAATQGASDVHIEPREKDLKIRFRVDGILQDTMTLPKSIEPALISRIKILSNLKIDEHRIPQDGQFQVHVNGRDIDLRIAIAPVVYGEQIVIRLLDRSGANLTLESLGLKGQAFRLVNEGITRPHGMTLATGPTGSGKSTTLYAALEKLNQVSVNIITLEDPVEYRVNGVNQIQVNPDVGLTFASGLRSILRQDPNIVMVGEIRDRETADLAVQAALTGHIVLSTIHTNSAAGVLPRLLDMQIEPFLIASTVNTVIGQRLVRTLCPKCREQAQSSQAETESIIETLNMLLPKTTDEQTKMVETFGYETLPLASQKAYTLYKAKGCANCIDGYKGRLGIYEVFAMTEAMEGLLAKRASTPEIQNQAQKDGMITMKQDGYLKVLGGLTTLEEVARVAADY